VWHYNVYLPSGSIDITSATIDGTGIQLHNPDEYAGDYQCGGQSPACAGNGTQAGLVCTDHPLTNPGDECAAFGLLPLGKDDGLTGLTFTATMDAYVALVKSGTHPCGGGNSAYQVYVNVHAGDTLT